MKKDIETLDEIKSLVIYNCGVGHSAVIDFLYKSGFLNIEPGQLPEKLITLMESGGK